MERTQTFTQWMHAVDRALVARCGFTSADLADQCYRDWYDDEMEPEDAAFLALADEGFPFEEVTA